MALVGEACAYPVLLYIKLSENAFDITRGSERAAGLDLCSAYNYLVKAKGRELVRTDLQIVLPFGTYGRIASRSGLAWSRGIHVGAGVIDSDYEGSVSVVLFNFGEADFEVKPGDRIAQIICEKIVIPSVHEIVFRAPESQRGIQGFGSSGRGQDGTGSAN
jgi:dUTP pyrophosphatase